MKCQCIKCSEPVWVSPEDGTLHCPECDADFTVDDVQEFIDGWLAVLPWLKAHPALQGKLPKLSPRSSRGPNRLIRPKELVTWTVVYSRIGCGIAGG